MMHTMIVIARLPRSSRPAERRCMEGGALPARSRRPEPPRRFGWFPLRVLRALFLIATPHRFDLPLPAAVELLVDSCHRRLL